jgi:hypothetical protein
LMVLAREPNPYYIVHLAQSDVVKLSFTEELTNNKVLLKIAVYTL